MNMQQEVYSQLGVSVNTNKYYTKEVVDQMLEMKANVVEGKELSTNDFTDEYKLMIEDTNNEVSNLKDTKADKSQLNAYQPKGDYLTSHLPLKTINGQSIAGIGDITIIGGGSADLSDYYKKSESDAKYQPKGNYLTEHQSLTDYAKKSEIPDVSGKADKSEIPSLDGYATEQWVNDKNYLTEHLELKTINGESIVGSGDITIDAYTKSESDEKYQPKGEYLTEHQNISGKVDKVEGKELSTNDFTNEFKEKLNSLHNYDDAEVKQLISDLTTALDILSGKDNVTEAIDAVNEIIAFLDTFKNDKTLASVLATLKSEIEGWVEGKGYLTEHQSLDNYALKSDIPDTSNLATKDEVAGVKTDVAEAFQPKGDYMTTEHPANVIKWSGKYNNTFSIQDDKINRISLIGNSIEAFAGNGMTIDNQGITFYKSNEPYEIFSLLDGKANKSDIPSLDGYATESYVSEQIGNIETILNTING